MLGAVWDMIYLTFQGREWTGLNKIWFLFLVSILVKVVG